MSTGQLKESGGSAAEADRPGVGVLLTAAVAGIGGAERPGQVAMAEAVQDAIESGRHLAVQAGTGTGKSLAYLVPALRHALTADGGTVVVSTATIALQRQLIERDLPRLSSALVDLLGREPVFAILKGRRNYLCLHKVHGAAVEDPADSLFDARSVSAIGRQVTRLHEWAASTGTGDRDELVQASMTGHGGRFRSTRASASARRSARLAPGALPSRRAKPPARRTSW